MCLISHYFIFNVVTKNMLKLYLENKNGILAPTLVCFFHLFGACKLVLLPFKKKNQINPEKNKTSFWNTHFSFLGCFTCFWWFFRLEFLFSVNSSIFKFYVLIIWGPCCSHNYSA